MKKKLVYNLVIILVILKGTNIYSQTLIIGSGLDEDTLTIIADGDIIFNDVHKSLDFIDILKYYI